MGSPLGPVLANICMCHLEEKWVLDNNGSPFDLFDSKKHGNSISALPQ